MNIYLTIFGKPRYLGIAKADLNNSSKRPGFFVVRTQRGIELGLPGGAFTPEQEEKYNQATSNFEESSELILQDVEFIREATRRDIENYYVNRRDEDEALIISREILKSHNLGIKIVDVEYTLDRKKLYFYFTSSQRIDFRLYVRDLAYKFKTRIEMRQIGIRDEARVVKGLASCGRPCCCSYWLRGFSPISIRIVKEQRSALNPTKISGLCGRLMCCMSYEKEYYTELWSKLPGPGARIKTEQGVYTLESLDLRREYVNIRFPNGRLVPVAISEFPDFQEAVLKGEEWGENKELAEKKKAAAQRIAAIKERAERKKSRASVKVNAKPFFKKPELSLEEITSAGTKPPKPKQNKNRKPRPNKKRSKPKENKEIKNETQSSE